MTTFNEEENIKRCIESVSFADEVIVVDSFSKDKTVEIAKVLGLQYTRMLFAGYGQQKELSFADKTRNRWILNIDADEVVTEELKKDILEKITQDKTHLFKVTRLTNYCGKWIKHGGWYLIM